MGDDYDCWLMSSAARTFFCFPTSSRLKILITSHCHRPSTVSLKTSFDVPNVRIVPYQYSMTLGMTVYCIEICNDHRLWSLLFYKENVFFSGCKIFHCVVGRIKILKKYRIHRIYQGRIFSICSQPLTNLIRWEVSLSCHDCADPYHDVPGRWKICAYKPIKTSEIAAVSNPSPISFAGDGRNSCRWYFRVTSKSDPSKPKQTELFMEHTP